MEKKYREIGMRFSLEQYKKVVEESELTGLKPSHYCKMIVIKEVNKK